MATYEEFRRPPCNYNCVETNATATRQKLYPEIATVNSIYELKDLRRYNSKSRPRALYLHRDIWQVKAPCMLELVEFNR